MWLDARLAIRSDRLGAAPKLVRTVMVVPDAVMPPDPPETQARIEPKRIKTVARRLPRQGQGLYQRWTRLAVQVMRGSAYTRHAEDLGQRFGCSFRVAAFAAICRDPTPPIPT